MLRLHDTATRQVSELCLRQPGRVSMYVCGPTVYDVPHIGHGRFALVFDVLRRYLEWSGLEVDHVSNVTDVDDKIIDRADREGLTEPEVASRFEEVWWASMDRLGVRRPTETPHATAYIPVMVEMISELVGRSKAYETPAGVYLDVSSVDGYGLLAHQSLESLRSGARVDVDEAKRSPLDFALWKRAKAGEPEWPSPWGAGRPGWHTECVVMSLGLLGDGFDIHGGAQDLVFPHHENERAQAVALGRRFASHWVHNGFVEVAGEKMSKSLGNFTSLSDLLDRTDPRAYRLLVLRARYRSPLEVTPATLSDAEEGLARLDALARRAGSSSEGGPGVGAIDGEALGRFRSLMDEDLDTPGALALIFDLVRQAHVSYDSGDAARGRELASTVAHLCGALGLELHGGGVPVDSETAAMVAERDAARAARDYAGADAIRDRLVSLGWTVEDTPGGTAIHR